MKFKHAEQQYLDIMQDILGYGEQTDDRTGTGTRELFGVTIQHDFRFGFPLLTTKKMHTKSILHELLWFISGSTNIKYLKDNKVRIWDEWADENGDLGPVYGKQFRDCGGVDQLQQVIDSVRNNPNSRRHIISLWHPPDIPDMALPPCHGNIIQFNVRGKFLDLATYQRSADFFLGLPFNLASYSFLLYMICDRTGLIPGVMTYHVGSAHIYNNHIEQCELQLSRRDQAYALPTLNINRTVDKIDDFIYEDFEIIGYECHPTIKARVSV